MEPNIKLYTICNKYKFYEILLMGFRGVVLTGTGFAFFNDSYRICKSQSHLNLYQITIQYSSIKMIHKQVSV